MKKLQSSVLLKTICYILMPILVLNILVNSFSIVYYDEYKEDIEGQITYFQTERFANNFLRNIYNKVNIQRKQYETNVIIKDEEIYIKEMEKAKESNVDYEQENGIKFGYYSNQVYDFLIIDDNGNAYTNIEKTLSTDTIEELKQYVKSKSYYWYYENNEINTTIEKLKFENIAYNSYFEDIKDSNVTVFASVRNENSNEFYKYNLVYKLVSNSLEYASLNISISSFLVIIMFIYIVSSIGHKKEEDGIYTNSLDDIPLEIVGIISAILLALELLFLAIGSSAAIDYTSLSNRMIDTIIGICLVIGIIIYITIAITGVTIVRRIKAKIFWKNTLIYKFAKWIKKNTDDILSTNINITAKLAIAFGAFSLIQFILTVKMINDAAVYIFWILLILWGYTFKLLLDRINKVNIIKKKIKDIYEGNNNSLPLEEEKFKGELKEVAKELNDISGGLSNAIEQAMKSERLKTELITNVSHDIKTPLTSIINYVDLMKKEKIENEKVNEYLDVLDNKSQRLKKLTEDLVEASKASSGNIKLNIERLNVKELIKQVDGEFEDKFEEMGLQIIETLPEDDLYIEADSRYMFRVLENMYVNISKYSLENSRVYIDVKKQDNIARIELKNISRDKLNISVDELMQRFVRGDSARTTEGSGLGISIASSLTSLQKGKFNIYLDGDLFKVVIEFKIA